MSTTNITLPHIEEVDHWFVHVVMKQGDDGYEDEMQFNDHDSAIEYCKRQSVNHSFKIVKRRVTFLREVRVRDIDECVYVYTPTVSYTISDGIATIRLDTHGASVSKSKARELVMDMREKLSNSNPALSFKFDY